MLQGEFLYEGKAKKIYATDNPSLIWIAYKDDATAFDGTKRGTIANKGIVNNRVSNMLFRYLETQGVETHLVEQIDDRNTIVKKLRILPIEVVVRNVVAGSLAKRVGLPEGAELPQTILELYYKNDDLHDPMINEYHARALGWASAQQLDEIKRQALRINEILRELYDRIGIILVDFKLEFGEFEGRIILGDEISPDTCRLWDRASLEKLDKDRFRRDMGKEAEAYQEVVRRIETILKD